MEMGNVGGSRNFGFGKQMAWAGAQALGDRYGDGHYATVAAHTERWGQFADWAKATQGVRDARNVSVETVIAYGEILAEQVRQETMSVAYAQNLLSSVNVVLEAMRGDRAIRISPTGLVGERSHVRDTPQHHGRDQGWARPSRRPLGAGVRTGDGQSAPRGRGPRHQPKPHSSRDDLARVERSRSSRLGWSEGASRAGEAARLARRLRV
jgi:hypothetical protein